MQTERSRQYCICKLITQTIIVVILNFSGLRYADFFRSFSVHIKNV